MAHGGIHHAPSQLFDHEDQQFSEENGPFIGFDPEQCGPNGICLPFVDGNFRPRSTHTHHTYPSNKHESQNKLRILMGFDKAMFD
jgi:hypothetical protein